MVTWGVLTHSPCNILRLKKGIVGNMNIIQTLSSSKDKCTLQDELEFLNKKKFAVFDLIYASLHLKN